MIVCNLTKGEKSNVLILLHDESDHDCMSSN